MARKKQKYQPDSDSKTLTPSQYISEEKKRQKIKNDSGCSNNIYKPECPAPYAEDPVSKDCIRKPVRGASKYCYDRKTILSLRSLKDPVTRELLPKEALKAKMGAYMDKLSWYETDSLQKNNTIRLAAAEPACTATHRLFNAYKGYPLWQGEIIRSKPQCYHFNENHKPSDEELQTFLRDQYRLIGMNYDRVYKAAQERANTATNRVSNHFMSNPDTSYS